MKGTEIILLANMHTIAERLQVLASLWHTYMTVLQKSFDNMS